MEEVRRVQVTGGSTYIVSLPKWWIKDMKIKPVSYTHLTLPTN